jgi:hypothetical protein
VDPFSDPLLLRKSGIDGNRARDSGLKITEAVIIIVIIIIILNVISAGEQLA